MTTPSRTNTTGKRPEIESELTNRYHVEFTFRRRVPIDDFDIDKSLANQARFEALDQPTVQTYTESVERGDAFPAVIAYRPGRAQNAKLVIIDGNHRLVAHDRANKPIDVYEIDRTTKMPVVNLMTFAFNTRHGRATSEEERLSHALFLIDNGASQADAAVAVNVQMNVLKRALAKANADKRADEVGVDRREWDALPQSARNRLLQISTDEGFQGAVHLAWGARLGTEEIFDLVALLNSSKSATKQRAIIRSETERFRDRLQDNAGTGGTGHGQRRPMTPRARVMMVLGQVHALPEDLGAMTRSFSEGERSEAARNIVDASERLRKLAESLDPTLT